MIPILSIVFGTLDRRAFVERAIASAFVACGDVPCEIIVVDGGSTDGTLAYLERLQKSRAELRVIAQRERLGAVAAFNAGFKAARGLYVANFNDDAEYVGQPLVEAVQMFERDAKIGQVAIPFWTCKLESADDLRATIAETCAAHGVVIAPRVQTVKTHLFGEMPYANFGVTRREIGDKVGWWGDYWTYGGDTELSCKVVQAGLRVAPLDAERGSILHYELQDDTRRPNREQAMFNQRWRGHTYPPPASAPIVRDANAGTPPAHMQSPALIEYIGKRHGSVKWQRPGSRYQYVAGAQHPRFWADGADVEWLLERKDKGRLCFRRAS